MGGACWGPTPAAQVGTRAMGGRSQPPRTAIRRHRARHAGYNHLRIKACRPGNRRRAAHEARRRRLTSFRFSLGREPDHARKGGAHAYAHDGARCQYRAARRRGF
jgi:hypothetical protein